MVYLKYAKGAVLAGAVALTTGCSSPEKQPGDNFAAPAPEGGTFENTADGSLPSADAFQSATPSSQSRAPNQSAIIRDPWLEYSAMRDKLGR